MKHESKDSIQVGIVFFFFFFFWILTVGINVKWRENERLDLFFIFFYILKTEDLFQKIIYLYNGFL